MFLLQCYLQLTYCISRLLNIMFGFCQQLFIGKALINDWILSNVLLMFRGKQDAVSCLADIGGMLLELGMELVVCETRLTLV